jgi:hypothetical protein
MTYLVTAAMLIVARPAMSQAYGRVTITNYTLFKANVVVEYVACKSDAFVVSQGRKTGFSTRVPGVNEAPTQRGACLVKSIRAFLIGDTTSVQPYADPDPTTKSQFVLAPEQRSVVNAPLRVFTREAYAGMGKELTF